MSETPLTRPVVLVHGLGGSAATTWQSNGWMDLIADAGRPPVGIDLLGHGLADKPHDPEAYVDMHRLVLDQLGDEPVDAIASHSDLAFSSSVPSKHPNGFHGLS